MRPCQAIQQDILTLADPAELPPDLREHLAICGRCQDVWSRLCRIESLIRQLPLAASADRQKAFLADAVTGGVGRSRVGQAGPEGWGALIRKAGPVLAGLAAAVLIAGGIYLLAPQWRRGPGEPVMTSTPYPLLQQVVTGNVSLARSATPADKLTALSRLAEHVRREAHDLARVANAEDLKALAGWYEKLVQQGIVPLAESLPRLEPAARAARLQEVASQLRSAQVDAATLAERVPPAAQPALLRIAESARAGEQKILHLTEGE